MAFYFKLIFLSAWRLSNFKVYATREAPPSSVATYGQLCFHWPGSAGAGQRIDKVCDRGAVLGRYLVVRLYSANPLTLCEVEAYGELYSGGMLPQSKSEKNGPNKLDHPTLFNNSHNLYYIAASIFHCK